MTFDQLGIAFFGITAMHFGLGVDVRLRRWAPIIGLCGQPFWAWHAWRTGSLGIAILVAAYIVVYINGWMVQWTGRGLRDRLVSDEAFRNGLILLATLSGAVSVFMLYLVCLASRVHG